VPGPEHATRAQRAGGGRRRAQGRRAGGHRAPLMLVSAPFCWFLLSNAGGWLPTFSLLPKIGVLDTKPSPSHPSALRHDQREARAQPRGAARRGGGRGGVPRTSPAWPLPCPPPWAQLSAPRPRRLRAPRRRWPPARAAQTLRRRPPRAWSHCAGALLPPRPSRRLLPRRLAAFPPEASQPEASQLRRRVRLVRGEGRGVST
jgi:hypothetical protein